MWKIETWVPKEKEMLQSPAVQKLDVLSSLVLSLCTAGGFCVNSGVSHFLKRKETGDSLQDFTFQYLVQPF